MKSTTLLLAPAAVLAGCATMQSFTARQELDRSPYYQTYAGFSVPANAAIAHLPIRTDYQALVTSSTAALAPLVDSMNARLDAAGWTTRLDWAAPTAQAPWAYVGTAAGLNARTHLLADSAVHRVMVIQALAPSRNWAGQLQAAADRQHVEGVLVIAVGPGDYFLREQDAYRDRRDDARGRPDEGRRERFKMLDLGTGYTLPIEWLNGADQPIPVVQVTGLLLSRDGTVLRAGAEGILAKRPAFEHTALTMDDHLTDEDVAAALTLRRAELPGQPLAWQVALENLVRQLLGRGDGLRRRAP